MQSRRRPGIIWTATIAAATLLAAAGVIPAPHLAAARSAGATSAVDVPMYRGSAAGNLEVTTGENLAVQWSSPPLAALALDAIPYGNTLFIGGMVFGPAFVAKHAPGVDPFYALDVRTGAVRWQATTPNWHSRGPAVVNGTVYLGVGNSWARSAFPVNWDTVTRGTGTSGVYAYDAATGKPLWTFNTPGAVHNTPLYHDGVVYAATGDRAFYAIDAKTGKQLWKLSIPSYDSVSSPILSGNLVYFGGAHPYAVYAVDIATHKVVWQTALPHVIGATDDCTPAVTNGLVYIEGATNPPGKTYTALPSTGTPVGQKLFALDARTGKIAWSFDEGLGHTPFFYAASTPTVVGGAVYFGSDVTASFYAVDAKTGVQRWAYHVGAWSLPHTIGESGTVHDGIVWTGTRGGVLLGLRASDGSVAYKKQLKAAIYAGSPAVVDNTLIVPSSTGQILAFSIPQLLQGH